MRIVVTCGPAWEPIDGMRRLTNASSGRLGAVLADTFATAGHQVLVFRGESSTAAPPSRVEALRSFGTNDDLAHALEEEASAGTVDAVFHAAALCDFKVAVVRAAGGAVIRAKKVPSKSGRLTVELEPATKLLPRLREWFPWARIVGWKFELNGGRDDALAAAWRQIREARTNACVVNGAAWGDGFGLCETPDRVRPCASLAELAQALLEWVGSPPRQPESGAEAQ